MPQKTRRVSLSAYVALAVLAGTWPVLAQQRSQPTFRTSSELVVIDLVAVDSRGRFISDLRREEIEVREDGRLQHVQLFRLVGREPGGLPDEVTPPSSSVELAGAEAHATTLPAGRAARRLLIVIDALSLSIDAGPRIREALLKAIEELPDAMPVMLVTIRPDVVVHQPFTTDRQTQDPRADNPLRPAPASSGALPSATHDRRRTIRLRPTSYWI